MNFTLIVGVQRRGGFARLAWLLVTQLWVAGQLAAQSAEEPIGWDKARTLHQRVQHGEKLSPEEQSYLHHDPVASTRYLRRP